VCAIIRSLPPAFPPATSLPTAAAAFSTPLLAFSTWELTFSNSQTSTPKTTTKIYTENRKPSAPHTSKKKKKSEKLTESSRPRRREDKATKTKETQNETHTHTRTRTRTNTGYLSGERRERNKFRKSKTSSERKQKARV
jgi:hypothetical protein